MSTAANRHVWRPGDDEPLLNSLQGLPDGHLITVEWEGWGPVPAAIRHADGLPTLLSFGPFGLFTPVQIQSSYTTTSVSWQAPGAEEEEDVPAGMIALKNVSGETVGYLPDGPRPTTAEDVLDEIEALIESSRRLRS